MKNKNLFMLLISMVIIGLLPMAVSASSWTSFQGNNDNNGVTNEDITTTFATNWTSQTDAGEFSGLDSGAVIDDNNVTYCVNYNGTAYAFNLTTGDQKWVNANIANDDPWSSQLSVPAYNDSRLYIGLTNGSYEGTITGPTIYALNATDGTVVWHNNSYIPSDHQLNSPIKCDSGKLYFGSVKVNSTTWVTEGGYFYCVNASNGHLIWRYDGSTKGYYGAAPVIIGSSYVAIGDDAGIVRAFDKTNETMPDVVDTLDTSAYGSIRSGIVYDNGNIYYTIKEGYLVKAPFNSGTFGTAIIKPLGTGVYSTSTPAVTGNYVYIGTDDGTFPGNGSLKCFARSNLDLIDTENLNGPVKASPVVTTHPNNEERVYVTTNTENGKCYWLTFNSDGEFVTKDYWKLPDLNYTLQGIAFANGWFVYGNDGGDIHGATGF